jgi:hypothetical protein
MGFCSIATVRTAMRAMSADMKATAAPSHSSVTLLRADRRRLDSVVG